jgi:Rrf2 family protein
MKLNRSVSYAVGVLLQIRDLSGQGQVAASKIARGCRFPPRFLYRILRRLVAAGLLHGTSGPGGGYSLARPPQRITLLDIVNGVETGLEPSVLAPVRANHRAAIARINRLCAQNAKRFTADLKRVKLADLGPSKNKRGGRRRRRRSVE